MPTKSFLDAGRSVETIDLFPHSSTYILIYPMSIFWSRKCKKFARSLWNRFKSPETSPYRYVHVQMSKFYHIQRRFSPETKRFSKRCLPLYQKGLAIEYLQTNKKFIQKVKKRFPDTKRFWEKFSYIVKKIPLKEKKV